jgi:hypothetical protein
MDLVEQIKEAWYKWIPGWLPVCLAILGGTWWIASTVTGMERDIQSLQEQMKDVQQYLRSEHKKSAFESPDSRLQYPQGQPQDAKIPPM